MRFKKTLVSGAAALAVMGAITGPALASKGGTKAPTKPAAVEVSSPDTDNIQQGDQTTPDRLGLSSKAGVNAKADESSGTESASETESTSETGSTSETEGSESDGPGGHEDPAGQQVDHQFEGEE